MVVFAVSLITFIGHGFFFRWMYNSQKSLKNAPPH
jgi:hypothetical protein